ncbi:MAG: hypothetical protein MUD12_12100 [Spirochaetes bacterium]|jgi:uncharacterized protein YgiM (DUF1202 family)|nr:hypothetical protein [Spirochaetota bacterium]
MKKIIIVLTITVFTISALFIYRNCAYSLDKSVISSESKCSVIVYLNDPDKTGTNVRDNPGGKIVKKLPLETDPANEAGIYLTIKKSKNGWLQIESVEYGEKKDASYKNTWVHGKLVGTGTTNYDEKPLGLYEKADKKSRVIAHLQGSQGVPVLACSGKWIYTEGKGKNKKKVSGWLDPDKQCSSAVTNCS